ncbi:DNA-binding protein [Mesorhizobium sp. M0220]|uniref:helix-turn-helix transcriptional regulator n=1 Tax=Mesorhizobium sp. M0220 TaxID=2956920 RepID=UPI003338BBA5
MSESDREYMNTQQAAKYLGFSTQFLEIGRHKGYGPAYLKYPQAVKYRRCDLDEWAAKHLRQHTSEVA